MEEPQELYKNKRNNIPKFKNPLQLHSRLKGTSIRNFYGPADCIQILWAFYAL